MRMGNEETGKRETDGSGRTLVSVPERELAEEGMRQRNRMTALRVVELHQYRGTKRQPDSYDEKEEGMEEQLRNEKIHGDWYKAKPEDPDAIAVLNMLARSYPPMLDLAEVRLPEVELSRVSRVRWQQERLLGLAKKWKGGARDLVGNFEEMVKFDWSPGAYDEGGDVFNSELIYPFHSSLQLQGG